MQSTRVAQVAFRLRARVVPYAHGQIFREVPPYTMVAEPGEDLGERPVEAIGTVEGRVRCGWVDCSRRGNEMAEAQARLAKVRIWMVPARANMDREAWRVLAACSGVISLILGQGPALVGSQSMPSQGAPM